MITAAQNRALRSVAYGASTGCIKLQVSDALYKRGLIGRAVERPVIFRGRRDVDKFYTLTAAGLEAMDEYGAAHPEARLDRKLMKDWVLK